MVLSLWRSLDQTDMALNDEGTGLGAPSTALVGYLGKNEDNKIIGDCPWCSAKGHKHVLHTYAINFEESITLCSGPLCLFPLVSKPLDNVRAALTSPQDIKRFKRKSCLSEPENTFPYPKQLKETKLDVVSNVASESSEPLGGYTVCSVSPEESISRSDEETYTEIFNSTDGDQGLSNNAQIDNCVTSTQDEAVDLTLTEKYAEDLIEMVPSRPHLFWKNSDKLCWLDSLLVALVNFGAIREESSENITLTESLSASETVLKSLCTRYNKICAYLKSQEHHCQGNLVQVPSDVLQQVEVKLAALRHYVFQFLQPKLKCELGQQETPVFALPLLLKSDDWSQKLFQHTGQWEFKCTSCGYALNSSVDQTVTTFTCIMADWHPLRAVHRAQCNNCHSKNQRRKLVLQQVSSVLALHFVEGLPRREVSRYSFDFQNTHYDIKIIIQYSELEHFITWVHQSDGSWLEFDDLKYPHCKKHKRFVLPASQMHLVFWEAKTRTKSVSLHEEGNPTVKSRNDADSFQDMSESVLDDTCIVEALTLNDNKDKAINNLNSSIGSTTLLDTFEALSHNDIVTLTLVEVKENSEGNPTPILQDTEEEMAKTLASKVSTPLEEASVCHYPPKSKLNVVKTLSTLLAPEVIPLSTLKSSSLATEKPPPATLPSSPNTSGLSLLFQRHHLHHSTPMRPPFPVPQPRTYLISEDEALPAKPAELFGGFRSKISHSAPPGSIRPPVVKLPGSKYTLPEKPGSAAAVVSKSRNIQANPAAARPTLSSTDTLRLKLMKKLKAKKKKLAKLNQLLCKCEGEFAPRPDSTAISSPYSVTSSTSICDSETYEHFFADLLSPSTTASNLSPDSTDPLEMLVSGQGSEALDNNTQENFVLAERDCSTTRLPQSPLSIPSSTHDDFLHELISGPQQSATENTDFMLDMFF